MENSPASINLVKKNEKSSVDKFINWTLSIGRLIVIITEIIAISAFLYRFSLDGRGRGGRLRGASVVGIQMGRRSNKNIQDFPRHSWIHASRDKI